MKYTVTPYTPATIPFIRKDWICPVCKRDKRKTAFEIELDKPDIKIDAYRGRWNWVCSERCINMFIFQTL